MWTNLLHTMRRIMYFQNIWRPTKNMIQRLVYISSYTKEVSDWSIWQGPDWRHHDAQAPQLARLKQMYSKVVFLGYYFSQRALDENLSVLLLLFLSLLSSPTWVPNESMQYLIQSKLIFVWITMQPIQEHRYRYQEQSPLHQFNY